MPMMLAVALALALQGCAPTHAPGKNAHDYESDVYQCEKEAAPQRDLILWRQMRDRCMRLRGWR